MRKTLTALSLAALLSSGSAMADQATHDDIKAALIVAGASYSSTALQQVHDAAADNETAIADAIAALVASIGNEPTVVLNVISLAVSHNPSYAIAIVRKAAAAAPSMSQAIEGGAVGAAPALSDQIAQAVQQGVDDSEGSNNNVGNTSTQNTSAVPSGNDAGSSGDSVSPSET
jgi:F0F1-type ATP synthase delta subunit